MWSDNQKRILCRLAFLLVCALPTSVTVYKILHPQTADQWEQKIQAQLGVRTDIDSIETPSPYETILRGMKFYDDDAEGTPILTATELRIQFGEINQVVIDHPIRLDSDGFQHIVERVNQRVIQSHSVQPRWIISVRRAELVSSSVFDDHFGSDTPRELWLEHLLIDMESGSDATAARLDFQLVAQSAPTPAGTPNVVSCFVERQRIPTVPGNGLPEQWLTLNTGNDALPCWLIDQWLPEIAAHLGTEVTFAGELKMGSGSRGPEAIAKGHFDRVDLQRIFGSSDTQVRPARWSTIDLQRFESFNGDVDHLAFLSIPGTDSPPVRIPKTLEVNERFDLVGGIRNAALEKYRQSSEHTILRRATYPTTEPDFRPQIRWSRSSN
jgi:hypothetical protein